MVFIYASIPSVTASLIFIALKFSSVPIKSVNLLLKYVAPIVTPSDQKNCSIPISHPKLLSGLSESFPKKGSYK